MSVYPGGIVTDHYSVGYDFFKNYFSDLGRTHNFLGTSNFTSMLIFMTMVTLIGLATIFYYITTPYFFSNTQLCRKLSVYGSIMGFITGIGYIGIAFTPADLLFVQIAFNSFFVAVILYSIAIYKNPVYPNFYAYVYLMYALVLGCYILIMLFGPSGRTPEGIGIQASSQKMVVYSQILCMMIQAYGSWMLNNKIDKDRATFVE